MNATSHIQIRITPGEKAAFQEAASRHFEGRLSAWIKTACLKAIESESSSPLSTDTESKSRTIAIAAYGAKIAPKFPPWDACCAKINLVIFTPELGLDIPECSNCGATWY